MRSNSWMPSHERLFGELDLREGEEGRSVYSPAAYLTDLLKLLHDSFGDSSILGRRPDLARIPLDTENTFTLTPYLDIVIKVLEGLIEGKPYEELRKIKHPFALPFSLAHARTVTYLRHLGVDPVEYARLFAARADRDRIARECLGLSPDDVEVVTTVRDTDAGVALMYGRPPAELADVEAFRAATSMTGAELRELLYQDPLLERSPATFFVHAGGPVVRVDDDDRTLVTETKVPIPPSWYDRACRFVRLARRTGLSFTDLDLLLTSCCGGKLDVAALRPLAAAVHLHREHGLPFAVIAALTSRALPLTVDDVPPPAGDLLAPQNRDYRLHLSLALDLAEADLVEIVRRYRARYDGPLEESPFDRGIGLPALSVLHRAGLLLTALGLSVAELFSLLSALEADPALRRYTTFPVLPVLEPGTGDCHHILAGEDPLASLWLAQTLVAVNAWTHESGFGIEELARILGEPATPEPEEELLALLEGLRDRFAGVALSPEALASDRFDERGAQVVHDVLAAYDDGVVSPRDSRLLRPDPETVAAAAYRAVSELGVLAVEDFLGLGLDGPVAEKIFTNLVLTGVLDADGLLITEPPADAGELALAGDYDELSPELFEAIAGAQDAFYPTDLAELFPDRSWAEQAELYDNLLYNGWIDEEGQLLSPDFFADPANAELFTASADLAEVTEGVLEALRDRVESFRTAKITFDPGAFTELSEAQLTALIDGLRFNGVLGPDDIYADHVGALTAQDVGLPLELYPMRRAILDTIRDQIETVKIGLYTFTPDDFVPIADEAMAGRVLDRLDGDVIEDGRVREEARELFTDPESELDLGDGFTEGDSELVRERIAAILEAQLPYRLDPAALTDLGFTDEERAQLVAMLIADGHLDDTLGVPEERVRHFATVTNALHFTLPGLEDYAKDIFFVLHGIAKESAAAVAEITGRVAELAAAQHEAVMEVLQDGFGVPAEVVEVLCAAVAPDALDLLLLPALGGRPAAELADPHVRRVYRRVRRFARLAAKLGLDAIGVALAFRDQDLAGKFPEPLALPPGLTGFDALLTGWDGKIYLFHGSSYWVYSAATYALENPRGKSLNELSPNLAGLAAIDAAFVQPDGTEWIVGRGAGGVSQAFTRVRGGTRWGAKAQVWGKVRNLFADPAARIGGAFVDADGRTYLFGGDQYVRYSSGDYTVADEGYPRAISEWWQGEGRDTPLPEAFGRNVDAAFHGRDGRTHVFSGERWFDGTTERPLAGHWGAARNTFDGAERIDAAYADGEGFLLFAGDQVVRCTDSPENAGACVADGYPRRIETWRPGVPAGFESSIEAAFQDGAGVVHLFRDGRTVALGATGAGPVRQTAQEWGRLAPVLPSGTVDAAFVGRDGMTYLFSGERYLRYSTADYSVADLGYPRAVAGDWGGLDRVDAAFVLDGATHLFGPVGQILDLPADYEAELAQGRLSPALRRRLHEHGVIVPDDARVTGTSPTWQVTAERSLVLTIRRAGERIEVSGDDTVFHVRYSTRNYTVPDAGYPRPLADNWWNLPVTLAADPGFARIDAVLTGRDNRTYLFSGERFVVFDARHRWWSEPYRLDEHWDSLLPFDHVDAAFVGKDGRTYVFSDDQYVRYSTGDYTRVDDRFPATVSAYWGNVANTIARTGRVDATLVMDAVELVDGAEVKRVYTYLFSGDQYVRYADHDYRVVQDGYPRPISALRTEPRMAALTVPLDGVDAAFADRRNVYLMRGGQWHVVSDTLYRAYDDLDLANLSCAFIENGAVLVERGGHWTRRAALEGPPGATPVRPLTLRTVPDDYRSGLDAVLTGADGRTYLFKGPNCYDTAVNHEHPIAREWGRPRNLIYQDSAVDAAFTGRDGRTYLFRGDQFVIYSGTLETIQGEPLPISAHWGGLTSVTLAYFRNGVTHLFEHPDATGTMRHLVYTGEYGPYTEPDPGYPALTDETFWKAPEGFPVPAAVLFEGDTMLLLNGERCVQFSEESGQWSQPRPIERVWRGFGQGLESGDRLRAAFTAADGATYFFFTERYARYAGRAFEPSAPIRDRWGRSVNPFVPDDGTAAVDAAIVFGDDTTYLFSGTQYVRYTGAAYRWADPGYPKPIAVNLRAEPAFAGLAETFEDAVAARGTGRVVDAAVANGRSAYLVVGGVLHVVSRKLTATYELATLGRVRNAIVDGKKVDAAFVTGPHTYLFSGDQYVRYSGADYRRIDEGYPRSIAASLPAELGIAALPEAFEHGLDAAFRTLDGRLYLFKGADFLHGGARSQVSGRWGAIRNEFAAGGAIDAAFVAPGSGELYVFRADQYLRYRPGVPDLVEEGYPRTIKDDWGDLPVTFEPGIDGAFVLRGRTYLTKGEQYVRYTGRYDTIDRTFPQAFGHRWSDAADYRLTDVHTIARFAELARVRPGLVELLGEGAAEPYERLAELFSWDVEELRWIKRNAGLITEFPAEEERFEIEFVIELVRLFAVAARIGVGPSQLYTRAWTRDDPNDALALMLERRHGPEEWKTLSKIVQGELNVLRRDALVPAVLHLHPDIADVRALYERMLIDVEMGAQGNSSPVREAIAATQLYVHRYLLDLEQTDADGEVRRQIRTWWSWLKDYRIWEANRKVFLYPENYIRPELRDTKTPAFRELESDLLQGEITEDSVQRAYKRYLDEYTEVSRLAIAGAYVYTEDGAEAGARRLVLFGRTRTEPRRHYYRSAEFRDGDKLSATWEPWIKVDVQIDADHVDPVHAFGRVFVFWTVVEAVTPDGSGSTTIVTSKEGSTQNVSAPPPKHRVRIYYSFYNLNKEWVPAQQLPPGPPEDGPISGVRLFVQASATLPDGDQGRHDSIVVSCSYEVPAPEDKTKTVSTAYALTPELYAVPVETAAERPRAVELSKIFAEPVDETGMVRFNSPADSLDGPWFSLDHKGGSFLCRPIAADAGDDPQVLDLPGTAHGLPGMARVNAGFELDDGPAFYFDGVGKQFTEVTTGTPRSTATTIATEWGNVGNSLTRTGVVDAVLVRGRLTYVFSGTQYYCFRNKPFGALEPGYPRLISANNDGFPQWERLDGAFTAPDGTEYFFSGKLRHVVPSASTNRSGRHDHDDQWEPPDDARFVVQRQGALFAFSGTRYWSYSDGVHLDRNYPKSLSTNEDTLPRWAEMGAAFSYGETQYYFDNDQHVYVLHTSKDISGNQSTHALGKVPTEINTTGMVHAAYVSGDHLYLVSGTEYVRYTIPGEGPIPAFVDDDYPKKLRHPVQAVFRRDDHHYVFGDGKYAVMEATLELDSLTAESFHDLAGNWHGLPPGFPEGFTGAMDAARHLLLFFGNRYVAYAKDAAVLRPYEFAARPHEIIRLTSSTAFELNRRLLVGGVPALLDPRAQETDELPAFSRTDSGPATIKVGSAVEGVPASSHLDFQSANGRYYWEIFFHAPMLIAQALNDAQRFEDARRWYEYVFDPSEQDRYWRFLPFLAIDVRALVAGCRADLDALGPISVTETLLGHLTDVEAMAPAFEQARPLEPDELTLLDELAMTRLKPIDEELAKLASGVALREKVAMLARLRRQYDLMGDHGALLKAYQDDPFDPHTIAGLRPSAYRRTVVMAYIDNLLDWGDLLFRQYTMESVDEARMLYILAYDLLGRRPEGIGTRTLQAVKTYGELSSSNGQNPSAAKITAGGRMLDGMGAVHGSVAHSYFFIPGNTVLGDYWTRVEDRLRKIRASLDIMGISRPLPLFEPPADVMALVRGAAAGVSAGALAGGAGAAVPHHRFAFTFRKAQELADKVRQFGNDLASVLERRDGEELSLLRARQESEIQVMTRAIRQAQVEAATESLRETQAALENAGERVTYYQDLLAAGLTAHQQGQIEMMTHATNSHFTAAGLKIGSALAYAVPQVYIGPFIMGSEYGGKHVGEALDKGSEISESLGEGFSMMGELFGIRAEQERQEGDWRQQLSLAKADVVQLGHRAAEAGHQVAIARRELEITDREIAHAEAVTTFLTGKFTDLELYRWMAGRLGALYFQTFDLAHESAKAAERAYQYERGVTDSFIQPVYWDSRRAGLLAGESLGLDLDRLARAHAEGDARGLEIVRRVSLLELDPVALLKLKTEGRCDFSFAEALFDRDFPGHYRRTIKTLSVTFESEGEPLEVNATLTQLGHKTILSADLKAVRHLMDGKGEPPGTVRFDWRPGQQIALSDLEQGRENNGLFELRFDDDRYLPFEGTGAVSTWRLETGDLPDDSLSDVTIVVKYTAQQGGAAFANAVKGMLKPYQTARFIDVAAEFPDEWEEFVGGEEGELTLPITTDMLPRITGSQITGLYATYAPNDGVRLLIDGDEGLALADGKPLRTPGLRVGPLTLVADGDPTALDNVGLVISYRAL
ncbi:hemopexin repeat-containing protein [Nonomuraea sp. NPDC050404]|uniref:hemopexin repeat-containing protein n=1 Tax=Nonomuraea sp. NPDC050404 TaxID=3155783 RepID=UPI0033EABB8B